ncbi:hypothetical protein C8J57DRAFT_1483833 [Mycena rebaudengoi]|nr:hypothetical protein C8J57DRAFT_1483833 [Mycena rebaudengoi]
MSANSDLTFCVTPSARMRISLPPQPRNVRWEKQRLALDPGRRRRKSKPLSSLGFLPTVLVVLGALGALLAVWAAGQIGLEFVGKLKPPHLALYQNETWDQVTNRSGVVRPLVSGDDRLDIIATQAAYQGDRYSDAATELVGDSEDTHFHKEIRTPNIGKISVWSDKGVRPTKAQDDIFEVPLYSGVIIQNATLSAKGLTAEVPLEFPLGVFLEQNLTAEHLRASFVILPPVKMDHLRNFSSWMPDYVLETQWRSRPGPPIEQKSLIDKAIDSFSLSVPLIDFHPIMSHCDVMLKAAGFNNTTPAHNQPWDSKARRHPHVTSRLHLRILNEQHLFNLEAYNTVHDKLRRTSAGYLCSIKRPLVMCIPSVDSDTIWGKHCPIAQSACALMKKWAQWRRVWSFLIRIMAIGLHTCFGQPGKLQYPDILQLYEFTCPRAISPECHSELERIKSQVLFEHQNALRGHRFHVDSHPRRRLVSSILRMLFGLFGLLLHIVYYWRLRSTVGISIRGQWLYIARLLAHTVKLMFNSSHTAENMVQGCFYIFLSVIPLFAITRMEFTWRDSDGCPPPLRMQRIQSVQVLSMLICAMCIFLAEPSQRELIASPLPPDPEATPPRSTAANIFWASVTAAYFMSQVLQLFMNHRAPLFGGMYKATVWLMVTERVLHFIVYLPAILGHIPNRESLSLATVINVLLLLVQAWQAWSFPAANTEPEEEHEN